MPEQVALGFPARNDRGGLAPVQECFGGGDAIAGIELPGQRGPGDAAGTAPPDQLCTISRARMLGWIEQ